MVIKIIKGKHPLSVHVVWFILLIAVLATYRFLPPSKCVFHNLTGLPCLTCGASRAVEAFLSGDFANMLYFNPLVVLFCGALFFFSFFKILEFILQFELKVSAGRKFSVTARALVIALIAANWLFLIVTGR